ncbi:sulfatase-like hydrolase/transferase [Clostridium sp. B9]|uniref:sulfatase-like hydrolase/transferase n=1 Tax=Clostridium sp. B9 TaxID=3423224 RepID=UPI003D2F3E69
MRRKRPNILFLLTDDQRFDTIHALGNNDIKTDNLDELVREGTSFTNAHIPSGTSGAVCMPSRAMIHSGRKLFSLSGCGEEIPKEHVTFGECLRNNGYNTYGIGKWHNGTESYNRSFKGGTDIFFGGMWDHWNVPVNKFDETGEYSSRLKFTRDFFSTNDVIEMIAEKIKSGQHSTELFSQSAIDFIDKYEEEDPFFLYVSFLAPHDPRTTHKRFHDMYDPEKIKLPENFKEEHPFDFGVRVERDESLASYPRDEKVVRKHIAEYYAMISHLDYEIGEIINSLKKKGLYEDTIIIFSGDNGLSVGQHGLMGKQNVYEHSIRVPLIFCGPNIPKGKVVEEFAYLFDIYPTVVDLLDIEKPKSVEGISLSKTFISDDKTREYLYLAFTDKIRGVKNKKYKLIEYRGKAKKGQLFDLENDKYEINNLYDLEEYREVVESLQKEMFKLRDEWNDLGHPLGKNYWENY